MNSLTSSVLGSTSTETECAYSEKLMEELADPSSVWYDLRIAEMSGFDYVFAPDAVCRQVNNLQTLSDFLTNIQTILGSLRTRTILISYWHDRYKELHFEKYDLKWADDIAIDWKKNLLDGTSQLDFIKTLYNHSEQLMFETN